MKKPIDLKTEAAEAYLAGVANRLADMTPAMKILSEELLRLNRGRAQAGLDPQGQPFVQRSALTLERYLESGRRFGATPLTKTGTMLRRMAPDHGANFASVSVNAIQAAVMHFGAKQGAFGRSSGGGPIPWGDIPARPMIGLGPNDLPVIIAAIETYLDRIGADPG